jgi:hypothetical protein
VASGVDEEGMGNGMRVVASKFMGLYENSKEMLRLSMSVDFTGGRENRSIFFLDGDSGKNGINNIRICMCLVHAYV